MPKYIYEGLVLEFDRLVADRWRGETVASSEGKAKSNLSYQYKKNNNRITGTRIALPGKLKVIN